MPHNRRAGGGNGAESTIASAFLEQKCIQSAIWRRFEGGQSIGKELTFEELASFPYTDLYKGIAAGNVPRRCHNCKHFFLTVGGHDTVYCNRIAPGETKRTCRQVVAHRKEKQKTPIHKEYFKAYNRLKARKNRGGISTDKWNRQVAMIQDWRDAALRGELSDAELKQKLDEA